MSELQDDAGSVLAALMREREEGAEGWWYVSFSGAEGFRGAVIVEAYGVATACAVAHGLGINPGGQAVGIPVPPERMDEIQGCTDRLLPREEIEALMGPTVNLRDLEDSP